jgi:hypothetical protein
VALDDVELGIGQPARLAQDGRWTLREGSTLPTA